MAKFLNEIKTAVYRSTRVLTFKTTTDLKRWLNKEELPWKALSTEGLHDSLEYYWNIQIRFYSYINQQTTRFEEALAQENRSEASKYNNFIQEYFKQIGSGEIMTSDWDIYPIIVNTVKNNLNAGVFLYVVFRKDTEDKLGGFSRFHLPFRTLLDLILIQTKGKGSKDWLLAQRGELTAIRDESQDALTAIRESFEKQEQSITAQNQRETTAHVSREQEWNEYKQEKAREWESLKKAYDEQLALAAPVAYWAERTKEHKSMSIRFATAFGSVLLLGIGLFGWLGMPTLSYASGGEMSSLVLALIPVAVPIFAGVWILKILGRLLSENLQLFRDARERQTMVKTFLALMRDGKNAKPIINDNDRILILHALFRPSSITSVDDAPPVHWFDILTNKMNSKDTK